MPKKVAVMLERIMRNFFWEGHKGGKINHLVNWEQTIKDINDGGLGIGSIQTRNLALSKMGLAFYERGFFTLEASNFKYSW